MRRSFQSGLHLHSADQYLCQQLRAIVTSALAMLITKTMSVYMLTIATCQLYVLDCILSALVYLHHRTVAR